jgi:hypothetical protein
MNARDKRLVLCEVNIGLLETAFCTYLAIEHPKNMVHMGKVEDVK